VTHNAYLGRDSIEPYMAHLRRDRGMFVLGKTSNPSSVDFQDRLIDGVPLYEQVASRVSEWGAECMGSLGYSSLGLVVGATFPEAARRLREIAPRTYFLAPGIGAQGGSADDARAFASANGLGVIFAFSRGIIYAVDTEPYRSRFAPRQFAAAAAECCDDFRRRLNEVLSS
jgi:orotidine-5'-phosphate decarboxylase